MGFTLPCSSAPSTPIPSAVTVTDARLLVVVRAGDAGEREKQNHTKNRHYPTPALHVPYIGKSTPPTQWDIRPPASVVEEWS